MRQQKLGFTICWALYGGLVWYLVEHVRPEAATGVLAIFGSGTYFVLLTIIFFGRRAP